MDNIGNSYVVILIVFSIIFAALLFGLFFKKLFVGFKPNNSDMAYVNSQTPKTEWKKISTRPRLFGLERKLVSDDELYFDDEHLYAINDKHQEATFKLTDITEVSKTSFEINNRRLWQIKIEPDNDAEIVFKFAHNYSLWNRNFSRFHKKMKLINPSAIKTKWSLWTA